MEIDEALAARLANVRRRGHVRALRKREWVFLSLFLVLALGAFVNFKRVIVNGRSMEPTFQVEAVVVWKLAPHGKLKPGDVIVFRQGSDELIKRIVYVADPKQAGQFPPPGFPTTLTNPEGWYVPANAPLGMTFGLYFIKVETGVVPTPPLSHTIYVCPATIFAIPTTAVTSARLTPADTRQCRSDEAQQAFGQSSCGRPLRQAFPHLASPGRVRGGRTLVCLPIMPDRVTYQAWKLGINERK